MTDSEMRELDAWIAEHVMGQPKAFGLKKRGYWYRPDAKGYTDRQSEAWRLSLEEAKKHEYKRGDEPVLVCELDTPRFTTDPAAAMEVLEKCFDKVGLIDAHRVKCGEFNFCIGATHVTDSEVEAKTLPLAICQFAKKLFA